jgi:phospholipase D3/4
MVYPNTAPRHRSTYNAWTELLRRAEKSVDIVAVYWNMRDKTGYKTAWQGEEVFNLLIETAKRGVKIRVAQNSANSEFGPLDDLDYLEKQGLYSNDDSKSKGLVEVQTLNFTHLFGSGILHTKLWVIDHQHFYLGSANMDWQSLTEV